MENLLPPHQIRITTSSLKTILKGIMGRNKNKNNRSTAKDRRSGGDVNRTTLKRDPGLPSFFKQRKQAFAKIQDTPSNSTFLNNVEMEENEKISSFGLQQNTSNLFENASKDLALSGRRDNSAKAFMRDVKQVIENSDVILQILDARDPLGSRSKQTESMAMANGKKVVLILNKVDLIPMENMQSWLRYLRNDFPTLAFKASTQQQRNNLKQSRASIDIKGSSTIKGKESVEKLSHGSEAIGANALLQLLKNYARTTAKGSNLKHQINVGVVGPPNVGKSSLINSLLRSRACAVASTPGWTKVVQGVMLEKGIRLLDCPGVVLGGQMQGSESEEGTLSKDEAAWNVLRNTVKVELIEDPIAPIQAMLGRVDAEQLSKLYNIEGGFDETDAHDFLLRVALMRGKLGKGGVPDLEGAARIVLHDWNIGRISFYSEPPAVHSSLQKVGQNEIVIGDDQTNQQSNPDTLTSGSSLVTGFSEAFDLAALLGEADAEAMGIKSTHENPSATENLGRGKDLIIPRARVYASEKAKEEPEAIVEDIEEPIENPADTTKSSLGKRRRGMDDMVSSDEEEDDEEDDQSVINDSVDDLDQARSPIKFNQLYKDEVEDQTRGRSPIIDGSGAKREPTLSRQQRELQRALGEYEVAGMARKRGDVRKAAKKSQKRLKKSGAGLVDVWNSSLALMGEKDEVEKPNHHDQDSNRLKKSTIVISPPVEKRRGLFDVLTAQEKDIVDEDEEL